MLSQYFAAALKRVLWGSLCLLPAMSAIGQLSVGSTGSLFIRSGTTFNTDNLVLIPSANLTIASNTIVKSSGTIPSIPPGNTSIARVYNMSTPITYTGNVGLIYLDAELGSNTESLLQVAYNSTGTGLWTTTTGSTINTTTNYVNNTVTAVPLAAVSATMQGVILPITYSEFSAQLNDQAVLINWKVEATTSINSFRIESSTDGKTWTQTAYVPAATDQTAYTYQDNDLNFVLRYYRIAVNEASGVTDYTNVITVRNDGANVLLQVVSSGTDRVVNFRNVTPDGISLFDFSGRLLKQMNVSQSSYNLGSLPSGVYILRYRLATQEAVRKVFMP